MGDGRSGHSKLHVRFGLGSGRTLTMGRTAISLKRSWAPAPSGIVDMARGAGVEERRVYETAGKRLGYGELNAAVGLLWKPQYRSQGIGGPAKAVTSLRMAQWSVVRER